MPVRVTTLTITSVTDDHQTWSISSNVRESVDDALEHLREMSNGLPAEPFYVSGQAGWRWTWEYVNDRGHRCSETVRIVP